MRIHLMGTRGIPARYGGFETFAEQLSKRLASRGHEVIVYGRRSFRESTRPGSINGVNRIDVPTFRHKYLETPIAALMSLLTYTKKRSDIILLCNAANSPFVWLARLRGTPVVVNVDGIERKRSKWSWLGKAWYRLGEFCSVKLCTVVVADAQVIADYYQTHYKLKTAVITYGASTEATSLDEDGTEVQAASSILDEYGLKSRGYLLYVSRFEPENNAYGVVDAYRQSGLSIPLVMVGDAPYAAEYKNEVFRLAAPLGESVIFTGFRFGADYHKLQENCLAYIQATEVGGTHPALIESMAHGNIIIANGTPENREVLGDTGLFYEVNNFRQLSQLFQQIEDNEIEFSEYRHLSQQRAQELYNWELITSQYEELLQNCLNKRE